jgi:hypothetical protein
VQRQSSPRALCLVSQAGIADNVGSVKSFLGTLLRSLRRELGTLGTSDAGSIGSNDNFRIADKPTRRSASGQVVKAGLCISKRLRQYMSRVAGGPSAMGIQAS